MESGESAGVSRHRFKRRLLRVNVEEGESKVVVINGARVADVNKCKEYDKEHCGR